MGICVVYFSVYVFVLYCCSFVMIMTLIQDRQKRVHSVIKAYVNNRRLSCDCRLFFKVPVWLFHFVSRSFQAVEVTLKGCILYSLIIFSFFSVNCFCLHKMSNICPLKICMHSFQIYVAWNLSSFFFSLLTLSVSYLTRCCLPTVCMLGAQVSCCQLILRNFHFK